MSPRRLFWLLAVQSRPPHTTAARLVQPLESPNQDAGIAVQQAWAPGRQQTTRAGHSVPCAVSRRLWWSVWGKTNVDTWWFWEEFAGFDLRIDQMSSLVIQNYDEKFLETVKVTTFHSRWLQAGRALTWFTKSIGSVSFPVSSRRWWL